MKSRQRRKRSIYTAKRQNSLHHHVYVVELKPEVAHLRRVQAENPNRNPDLPCVYVGMTGLAPEERLQNHLQGLKSSFYVKHYGIKLLPKLFAFLNPMPYEAACVMEAELAEELRQQGYTVTGGH
ncbi:MAG: hypothetical protein M2R45_01161 [Verrucomicrobia subdivision 3 bacterium]|nr:hypothetical protein [Limisphaerales bacterium]MCS1415286.1 hypothetical protein [Limisphaerales bacterium]